MVNVNVGVFNGVPPTPIRVIIDNLNSAQSYKFSSSTSFNQNFDLPPGEYMLTVTGINPKNEGAHTVIDVTGTFAEEPLPSDTSDVNTSLYSEIFYFKV